MRRREFITLVGVAAIIPLIPTQTEATAAGINMGPEDTLEITYTICGDRVEDVQCIAVNGVPLKKRQYAISRDLRGVVIQFCESRP